MQNCVFAKRRRIEGLYFHLHTCGEYKWEGLTSVEFWEVQMKFR